MLGKPYNMLYQLSYVRGNGLLYTVTRFYLYWPNLELILPEEWYIRIRWPARNVDISCLVPTSAVWCLLMYYKLKWIWGTGSKLSVQNVPAEETGSEGWPLVWSDCLWHRLGWLQTNHIYSLLSRSHIQHLYQRLLPLASWTMANAWLSLCACRSCPTI